MDLWRISKYSSLSGEGGLRYSARWHSAGKRIVYLAESPAGALIEVLVHMELNEKSWPRHYNLMRVTAPDDLETETIKVPGDDWRQSLRITREIGDEWLDSRRTALARVPSAILPNTWNALLNPARPTADQIRVVETIRAEYDPRLFAKS
ncbi:MAG: RES family NAD+ phosphorylase [Acidobacteriaceae bacterium]|nr:RES family NAD+ phosphorylase [Acidobacteriaceae bacterium]